jgi:ABC-type Fe3+/spermidine/putrescine transport system ATPase subunit
MNSVIEQVALRGIYDLPQTRFVAEFIGETTSSTLR